MHVHKPEAKLLLLLLHYTCIGITIQRGTVHNMMQSIALHDLRCLSYRFGIASVSFVINVERSTSQRLTCGFLKLTAFTAERKYKGGEQILVYIYIHEKKRLSVMESVMCSILQTIYLERQKCSISYQVP